MILNKTNLFRNMTLCLVTVLCVATGADSAIYIEEWESNTAGWKIKSKDEGAAYGSLSWDGSGFLRIGASTGAGVSQDIIYADITSSGGNLAGGKVYDAVQYIEFDFYASVEPVRLSAYFKGAGVIWLNDITSVTAGSWDTYTMPLGLGADGGWLRQDGFSETTAAFMASAADVDEIGILIWYQASTAGQVFGLDNFSVVPEPETWLMLGFALLSIGYTFRRQIYETLQTVLIRIQ